MRLYSYWRSTAAYRVRIALNLKGIDYETVPVNLVTKEQLGEAYTSLNPDGRVPLLMDGAVSIAQSGAIIDYLDTTHPNPPLLPTDPIAAARVRQIANLIACDIHPLNNIGVLRYLKAPLGQEQTAIGAWYHHWVRRGFDGLETMLADDGKTGRFAHGDEIGLADLHIVPQLYNARRFNVPLDRYPTLVRIEQACLDLPAFAQAVPENQPDAPES